MSLLQRVSEPKPSKCGKFTNRTVKVGNRLLGTIETPKLKPGEKPEATFWATERVVRVGGEGRYLLVSRHNVSSLRTYAVKNVGLRCADGTQYRISLESITAEAAKVPAVMFLGIPVGSWTVDLPPEEERVANTMAKMRLAGRGRKSIMSE